MARRRFSSWFLALLVFPLGLLTLATVPSRGDELTRQKQIADVERQIAELTKKLEELKRQPANPKPSDGTLDPEWVKKLTWRGIGPATMGGRIVALAVYVGALGRLYGPSEERGVFKTTDGGKTWEKVLFLDDRTGIIDMQINPAEPETLLAAAWERRRDGFDSHPGEVPLEDGYDGYDP